MAVYHKQEYKNLTIVHQDIIQYGYYKGEKRIVGKKFNDGMYPAAFYNTSSIFICDMRELEGLRLCHEEGKVIPVSAQEFPIKRRA